MNTTRRSRGGARAAAAATLTETDRARYARQLPLFGEAGQQKLKRATVTIAGAGGLGSVSAAYLTVAGVGRLQILDDDRVERSNLNRQILHWDRDLGEAKAASFEEKLTQMNADVEVVVSTQRISAENVAELVGDSDAVVDALDNFQTRYILNRFAVCERIPFFHGGVYGFEGQVTTVLPGQSACLRCIFPEGHPSPAPPVLGATCGVVGCIQATEVVKCLVGVGTLLTNRLLIWDGVDARADEFVVERNPACPDCGQP
jgi:molybdopterin/thiamine biosynthesis adenylyltransferase